MTYPVSAKDVDKLVDDLAKPTMVFRFARADRRPGTSATTRMNNARKEILEIIELFAVDHLTDD